MSTITKAPKQRVTKPVKRSAAPEAVGTHAALVAALMSHTEVRAELKQLEPELALLDAMLKARTKAKLTQSEIAKRMATTKSAVSRLEASLLTKQHSPSLATLRRYAHALGYELKLSLVQQH
jgi:DNA-binding XRE family transcriptional regulator